MRHLMNYIADKGSVVVNGICLSNGYGDGMFGVLFDEKKEFSSKIWIDLRCTPQLEIWEYDCILEHKGETQPRKKVFTSKDFDNAEAVSLSFDDEYNLIISKLF